MLVHGARTVLHWRRAKPGTRPGWTDRLLTRRPTNVVLVAMANKTARVAWPLLRYERIYEPTPARPDHTLKVRKGYGSSFSIANQPVRSGSSHCQF